MIFSYQTLKKYLKKDIAIKELTNLLTFHSLEVEVKKEKTDYLLDIDLLPNRYPDTASYIGIAREINALLGKKDNLLDQKDYLLPKNLKKSREVSISIENKNDCLIYKGIIIKDIKVSPSPKWLKDFLEKHNIVSHNFLVDIANYVMLETGQPLHIFDLDTIKNKKIIVRRAKNKEKIKTLDGQEFVLNKDILVIADSQKPIVIAGIKGGEGTGVSQKTKNIFVEAANFDPALIYKVSKKLALTTDASSRFSHNLPLKLVDIGLARATNIILKKGGRLEGFVQAGKINSNKKFAGFNEEEFENLIGIKINFIKARQVLANLGFVYKNKNKNYYIFEVPWWRKDINIPEDLYEEIARVLGYQNLPAKKPLALIEPPKRNDRLVLKRKIQNFLVNAGFDEVYNYSLTSAKKIEQLDFQKKQSIKLFNPISKEFEYLRPTLAIGLLENIKFNFSFFDKLFLFEIGKIFSWQNNKTKESQKVGLAIAFKKKSDKESFFILKGIIESFLNGLGLDRNDYKFSQDIKKQNIKLKENFFPKKFAYLVAKNKTFGILGEIKPSLLKFFGISDFNKDSRVVIAEIDFDSLLSLVLGEREYQPIIPYPAVIRDLSFFVKKNTKIEDVLITIESSKAKYLREADLFDIFIKNDQENKKSLGFHLIFQAKDHTLTGQEIEKDLAEIKKALKNKFKIEIR